MDLNVTPISRTKRRVPWICFATVILPQYFELPISFWCMRAESPLVGPRCKSPTTTVHGPELARVNKNLQHFYSAAPLPMLCQPGINIAHNAGCPRALWENPAPSINQSH